MNINGFENVRYPLPIEIDYDFDLRCEAFNIPLSVPNSLPEIENFFKLVGFTDVEALPYCNAPSAKNCATLRFSLSNLREVLLLASHIIPDADLQEIRLDVGEDGGFVDIDQNSISGLFVYRVIFYQKA